MHGWSPSAELGRACASSCTGAKQITLVSNDPEEKLALSFSLAQSAKLFVFEVRASSAS
jgi:uncharacterized Rmd1/YagE family protein